MKIKFLDYAVKELDDTFEWYEAQQKNLGTQFLREFDTATKRICAYPTAYAVLSGNIRRSLIKRFPYGVLYAIEDQTIIIVAIAHLHRQPNYWLDRLKLPS
jgi:plasmid stabilization system protein ParE